MSDRLIVLSEEDTKPPKPWYKEGLRFKCTECGQCCTGAPGFVWVTDEEIEKIANFLKLSIQEFTKTFLRKVDGRVSLREMPKSFDCVFLRNKRCSIYPVRPTQCKTFPWWSTMLSSEEAWREAAGWCEGISEEAPVVPYETIAEGLQSNNKK